MGVPVVGLIGTVPLRRLSFSLLSNVGLPELAAISEPLYVEPPPASRTTCRASLRERMKSSAPLDATRFARNLEAAYRAMWRRWCEGREN